MKRDWSFDLGALNVFLLLRNPPKNNFAKEAKAAGRVQLEYQKPG